MLAHDVLRALGPGSHVKTGLLQPSSTLSLAKSGSNPTFNFAGDGNPAGPVPEEIVKVGSTYYCVYAGIGATTIRLASASSPAGPWSDLGTLFSRGSGWESGQDLYGPSLTADGGTYYIFYSTVPSGGSGSGGSVGVASASTITGPYTKYASNPVLSPSAAGNWDSRRVGEASVLKVGSTWVMAYMGESTAAAYQASEKVGIATASSPFGTWSRAAGNPLIDWGAGGAWDNALVADPSLLFVNGWWWCWYTGGQPGPPWKCGLAYASDPTGTWTKVSANPLLSPGVSGFDQGASWRGSIFVEDGVYHVVYGGLNSGISQARGGNATLSVT